LGFASVVFWFDGKRNSGHFMLQKKEKIDHSHPFSKDFRGTSLLLFGGLYQRIADSA